MLKIELLFDKNHDGWYEDKELTNHYLYAVRSHIATLVNCRGHVFLNEILDILGYKRTYEGQIYGLVPENFDFQIIPSNDGEGFVIAVQCIDVMSKVFKKRLIVKEVEEIKDGN